MVGTVDLPVFTPDLDVREALLELKRVNRTGFVLRTEGALSLVRLSDMSYRPGARTLGEAVSPDTIISVGLGGGNAQVAHVLTAHEYRANQLVGGFVAYDCDGPPEHVLFAVDVDPGPICRVHRTPVTAI